jgi:hypothetical protein
MQISGTGDVVLTDIRETSASLLIDENVTGRLSIRDNSDYLIAEITKAGRKPMELGLEPGLDRITLQQGDSFDRAEVLLAGDSQTPVAQDDFKLIAAAPGIARGESSGGDAKDTSWADEIRQEAEKYAPQEDTDRAGKTGAFDDNTHSINIQLVPGQNILGGRHETDHLLLGLFIASGHNLRGLGASVIGLTNTGYVLGVQASGIYNSGGTSVTGIQAAGIFNTAGGEVQGIQAAGIFNTAGDAVWGIQTGGIFNTARGNVLGFQNAGIFNTAGGDVQGIQSAGIFNTARGSVLGIQTGLVNVAGEGTGNLVAFDGGVYNPVTVQAGLVNISRNENTVPFGLVNIVKNGLLHPAVYYDSANFMNFSFRSGSKHFYSLFSIGTQRITTVDNLFVSRAGFGFELPLGKAFFDLDISGGTILNPDTLGEISEIPHPRKNSDKKKYDEEREQYNREVERLSRAATSFLAEIRLSGGCKVFEHLGAFAGLSYTYLFRGTGTSPNPDSAWLGRTWGEGENIHKIGVFAGLQF